MTDETTIDPENLAREPYGPYPLNEDGRNDLANRFTYHPPQEGQPQRYEFLRDHAHMLAVMISENVPPSRERSTALTHLETAIFWANAGIARNEPAKPVEPDDEMDTLEHPHQKRVLAECRELEARLKKLNAFISENPEFLKISIQERGRLVRQRDYMSGLAITLRERIDAF